MANGNGGSNFLVGFFMGAAMGAMAALLLAPKSGRELRESLIDEGTKLRGRASEEGRKLRERAEEKVAEVRGRGEEAYARGREGLAETAGAAKKTAQSVKKALSQS
jgi:gas vesicle protein